GINVNVTLLFDLDRYREVAEAFVAGLEMRLHNGKPLEHVASVASFFLSRIDTVLDSMLEEKIKKDREKGSAAGKLVGKVAIACAKGAYRIYNEVFGSERFKAKPQRLLWASTGTKNKAYSDVMYMEALIGPDTVNTVPLQTLNAYRDHGSPAARLAENMEEAEQVLRQLSGLGIDLKAVSQKLEEEGIEKFIKPFEHLLLVIEQKRLGEVAS
ncbi:MAG: transaldolase, partial [Bacteroidota bacterium]|nr:transaldolase [Bacteroidota bacterium]